MAKPIRNFKKDESTIIINGIRFVQAVHAYRPKGSLSYCFRPAFTEHGYVLFAVPGGGRATKEQLEQLLK